MKPSKLRDLQSKKFKFLLRYAYDNVAFYHRKFKDAGFRPDDFKGFDDLKRIPTTTKFELQACEPRDLVSKSCNFGSLIKRTTSGSTGIPLTVYVDGRVEDFYSAVWLRSMFECGLRVLDKMAVIADPRGFPKGKTFIQRLGFAERRYISIFDSVDKQLALLQEFRPDVVKGYASSLYILAEEFGENLRQIGVRLIFSGAEVLNEAYRRAIGSAFGVDVFDFYACSELGLLAWECKEHEGYHVNADCVLMEFLDEDGWAVAPGEKGRIVCTGLFNKVMPLIRYELEDIGVFADDTCTCCITLPLIKSLEGRVDDLLVTVDGRLVSPTVFFPYPFDDVDWIRQFRVIQESHKKLVIQVEAKKAVDNQGQIIEAAKRKIHELFGEEMEVVFEFVDKIPLDKSGKLRKIISHINNKSKVK
ncbi:MAG: phenylacetate--CoA ligase family protein [Candidatus Bathyarchaeia archaeon]